jgi:peptide-methionine (S)-S-oxide reductase
VFKSGKFSPQSAVGALLVLAALFVILTHAAPVVRGGGAPLPNPKVDAPLAKAKGQETAVVAGGCFWGVQGVFQHVRGVLNATSGYSGGPAGAAEYEVVSTGSTGHAESVKVTYDPSQISYGQLLQIFFSVAHDPTELNHQGPDYGTQYRSLIFYADQEQKRIAEAYIAQLDAAKSFGGPIVTQVVPLKAFYPAEAYHQNYLQRHPDSPYIVINDLPKLTHLREQFPSLYVGKQ